MQTDFTKITKGSGITTKVPFLYCRMVSSDTLPHFFHLEKKKKKPPQNPKPSNTCVIHIQHRKVFSKVTDSWQEQMAGGEGNVPARGSEGQMGHSATCSGVHRL